MEWSMVLTHKRSLAIIRKDKETSLGFLPLSSYMCMIQKQIMCLPTSHAKIIPTIYHVYNDCEHGEHTGDQQVITTRNTFLISTP